MKAIIFDLGGVILSQPENIIYFQLKEQFQVKADAAFLLWQQHEKDINNGKMLIIDFMTFCKRELHLLESPEELTDRWRKVFTNCIRINKDVIDFIDTLHNSYNLYLLTDTNDIHYEVVKSLGVFDHFTHVFASCKEGVEKADGTAFTNLLEKSKLEAKDCLFIDDSPTNIQKAAKHGIQGIVYISLEEVKEKLQGKSIV